MYWNIKIISQLSNEFLTVLVMNGIKTVVNEGLCAVFRMPPLRYPENQEGSFSKDALKCVLRKTGTPF